jgi:hypothetical protein
MNVPEKFANQPSAEVEDFDVVDEASRDSFPASDPPSWFGGQPKNTEVNAAQRKASAAGGDPKPLPR